MADEKLIPDLTKMQKIALLLAFYHSPNGAAKNAAWEFFSNDKPPFDETVFEMLAWIINGVDESRLNWGDALMYMQLLTTEAEAIGPEGSVYGTV